MLKLTDFDDSIKGHSKIIHTTTLSNFHPNLLVSRMSHFNLIKQTKERN